MRKVRNKSVVIAAKLPQRMTWSRPLLRKPLSGPMIVAGAGVTGHEEATSWRGLASVPNAAAVPPSSYQRSSQQPGSPSPGPPLRAVATLHARRGPHLGTASAPQPCKKQPLCFAADAATKTSKCTALHFPPPFFFLYSSSCLV